MTVLLDLSHCIFTRAVLKYVVLSMPGSNNLDQETVDVCQTTASGYNELPAFSVIYQFLKCF